MLLMSEGLLSLSLSLGPRGGSLAIELLHHSIRRQLLKPP